MFLWRTSNSWTPALGFCMAGFPLGLCGNKVKAEEFWGSEGEGAIHCSLNIRKQAAPFPLIFLIFFSKGLWRVQMARASQAYRKPGARVWGYVCTPGSCFWVVWIVGCWWYHEVWAVGLQGSHPRSTTCWICDLDKMFDFCLSFSW